MSIFKKIGHAVEKGAKEAGKEAGKAAGTVAGGVTDAANTVADQFNKAWNTLSKEAQKELMSVFDDLKKQLDTIADQAKKGIESAEKTAISSVEHAGSQAVNDVKTSLKQGLPIVEGEVKKYLGAELDISKKILKKYLKTEIDVFKKEILPVVEKLTKTVLGDVLDALMKSIEKKGINILYQTADAYAKQLRSLQRKSPEYAESIEQLGLNLEVGPLWLMWSSFITKSEQIVGILDRYRHHPPKLTRAEIIDFVNALAPDFVMVDISISAEFVVVGTSATKFSVQLPFIDTQLIDKVLDDLLKALGVPAGTHVELPPTPTGEPDFDDGIFDPDADGDGLDFGGDDDDFDIDIDDDDDSDDIDDTIDDDLDDDDFDIDDTDDPDNTNVDDQIDNPDEKYAISGKLIASLAGADKIESVSWDILGEYIHNKDSTGESWSDWLCIDIHTYCKSRSGPQGIIIESVRGGTQSSVFIPWVSFQQNHTGNFFGGIWKNDKELNSDIWVNLGVEKGFVKMRITAGKTDTDTTINVYLA